MRIETGQKGGTRRATDRRGVVVRQPEALGGEPVQVRRGDLRPERADVAVAHVVEQHHEDVGCPRRRPPLAWPGPLGLLGGTTDVAREALVSAGVRGEVGVGHKVLLSYRLVQCLLPISELAMAEGICYT